MDISRIGRLGAFVTPPRAVTPMLATSVAAAGFGALWIGGNPGGDLPEVETALDNSEHLVVATGVINTSRDAPDTIAKTWTRLTTTYGDRLIIGVGVGHHETDGPSRTTPIAALNWYLDNLAAEGVPLKTNVVVGALGPKLTKLAGERTAGCHPYLTTPVHSRLSREIVGIGPVVAPEHKVVLSQDARYARGWGRRSIVDPYLSLDNYVRSLRRQGFTEHDVAGDGSDLLIDSLVAFGSDDGIRNSVEGHLRAGASHVAVQLLDEKPSLPEGFERLAVCLGLN